MKIHWGFDFTGTVLNPGWSSPIFQRSVAFIRAQDLIQGCGGEYSLSPPQQGFGISGFDAVEDAGVGGTEFEGNLTKKHCGFTLVSAFSAAFSAAFLEPFLDTFRQDILVKTGLFQVNVSQGQHSLNLLSAALGQLVDQDRLDKVQQVQPFWIEGGAAKQALGTLERRIGFVHD